MENIDLKESLIQDLSYNEMKTYEGGSFLGFLVVFAISAFIGYIWE